MELDRLDVREDHYFTEWVGETMFGGYSIIAIVVLLNMLIAMMANSFAAIDVSLRLHYSCCPFCVLVAETMAGWAERA